jgi:hypothetical protein
MVKKWFFSHDGQSHGPFTVEEMKELASQGKIDPQDRIWGEGSDPEKGVQAEVALRGIARKTGKAETPAEEQAAPLSGPADEASVPAPAQPSAPPARKKKGPLAGSKAGKIKKGSLAGSKARKLKKGSRPGSKDGLPVKQEPAEEAPVAQPERRPDVPATPVAPPFPTDLPLQELFRKARFALEQWVDEEDNVDTILIGDMEVIRREPAVAAILDVVGKYGSALVDKILKDMEFVVQNRKKYYLALVARRNS